MMNVSSYVNQADLIGQTESLLLTLLFYGGTVGLLRGQLHGL
jgi:hypothetical protein